MMNIAMMKRILTDRTIVAELRSCRSVRELEACLNKAGAECTRDEALRFLRACKKLGDEQEERNIGKPNDTAEAGTGIIGACISFFKGKRTAPKRAKPVTIDAILNQMNQQTH